MGMFFWILIVFLFWRWIVKLHKFSLIGSLILVGIVAAVILLGLLQFSLSTAPRHSFSHVIVEDYPIFAVWVNGDEYFTMDKTKLEKLDITQWLAMKHRGNEALKVATKDKNVVIVGVLSADKTPFLLTLPLKQVIFISDSSDELIKGRVWYVPHHWYEWLLWIPVQGKVVYHIFSNKITSSDYHPIDK
jgi:hypothetical protein